MSLALLPVEDAPPPNQVLVTGSSSSSTTTTSSSTTTTITSTTTTTTTSISSSSTISSSTIGSTVWRGIIGVPVQLSPEEQADDLPRGIPIEGSGRLKNGIVEQSFGKDEVWVTRPIKRAAFA